MKIFRRFLV